MIGWALVVQDMRHRPDAVGDTLPAQATLDALRIERLMQRNRVEIQDGWARHIAYGKDMTFVVVVVVAAGLIAVVLVVSSRVVGQIAEQYGEDPAWWKARMLPLRFFGPVVAKIMLERGRGGGGGFA
jgi:hypothetical protein